MFTESPSNIPVREVRNFEIQQRIQGRLADLVDQARKSGNYQTVKTLGDIFLELSFLSQTLEKNPLIDFLQKMNHQVSPPDVLIRSKRPTGFKFDEDQLSWS